MKSNLMQLNKKITVEEIKRFSQIKNRSKKDEKEMYSSICALASENEELEGIKLFLEDNDYNFDSLALFLSPNPIFAMNSNGNKFEMSWIKYAAIFIFISIGIIVYNTISSKHSTHVKQHMFKDNGFYVTAGEEDIDPLVKVINQYRQNDFSGALKLLNNKNTIINKDTLHYVCGLLHLNEGNYEEAASELGKVNNNSLRDKTNYFLALSYLHQKKFNQAKLILVKTLESSEDSYIKQKCDSVLIDNRIWEE